MAGKGACFPEASVWLQEAGSRRQPWHQQNRCLLRQVAPLCCTLAEVAHAGFRHEKFEELHLTLMTVDFLLGGAEHKREMI